MNRNQIDKIDHNCSERAISSCCMKNPHFKKASIVHICTTGCNCSFLSHYSLYRNNHFQNCYWYHRHRNRRRQMPALDINLPPSSASEQVRIRINSRFTQMWQWQGEDYSRKIQSDDWEFSAGFLVSSDESQRRSGWEGVPTSCPLRNTIQPLCCAGEGDREMNLSLVFNEGKVQGR